MSRVSKIPGSARVPAPRWTGVGLEGPGREAGNGATFGAALPVEAPRPAPLREREGNCGSPPQRRVTLGARAGMIGRRRIGSAAIVAALFAAVPLALAAPAPTPPLPVAAEPADPARHSCEAQVAAAAQRYDIPLAVFYAVGLLETGGRNGLQPFTMNIEGRSAPNATLKDALATFATARATRRQADRHWLHADQLALARAELRLRHRDVRSLPATSITRPASCASSRPARRPGRSRSPATMPGPTTTRPRSNTFAASSARW